MNYYDVQTSFYADFVNNMQKVAISQIKRDIARYGYVRTISGNYQISMYEREKLKKEKNYET